MIRSRRRPKIFGTGLIALDLVVSDDVSASVHSATGGSCGNVLSTLAYLGWESVPVARMGNDPASQRVKADMKHWGVSLQYASCAPTSHTPIIIQEIRRGRDGAPTHRFSWTCPRCGEWLPGFKAVTKDVVELVRPQLRTADVFFMDRISRAAITMAAEASKHGALIFLEPSAKGDPKLLLEALRLAHVVKYAEQRFKTLPGVMSRGSSVLLEVQTLGGRGLRYRHRLRDNASEWKKLDAITAPHLADTCGAGDWCSAGLISKIATAGDAGLRAAGENGILSALRHAQAMAAWSCGFEGARGGMYVTERQEMDVQVEALASGRDVEMSVAKKSRSRKTSSVACPACPSGSKGISSRRSSRRTSVQPVHRRRA